MSGETVKQDRTRELGVDLLKFICMMGVVALHTQRNLVTMELYNPILYYLARFSMPVFFMINGYLIMGKEKYDFKYYKRKILNIIRVVVIWGCISVGYSFLLCGDSIKESVFNGIKCALGFYIVPFWYIFTFAIIYTILLVGFDWIKQHIKKLTVITVCVCVILDICSFISICNGGGFIDGDIDRRWRVWTWIMYFFLGHTLGSIDVKFSKAKGWIMVIITSVLSSLTQYLYCYKIAGIINSGYLYNNIVVIIWSVLIFIVFKRISIESDKSRKIVMFLSSNCFGVFLIHEYITNYFDLTAVVNNALESTMLWLFIVALTLLITALLRKIPYVKRAFEY